MKYVRLARCSECQRSMRGVEYHIGTLCEKCLTEGFARLVNEAPTPRRKKRRVNEGSQGRPTS